jgi:hypothetical protein
MIFLLPFPLGLPSGLFIITSVAGGLGDLVPFRTWFAVSDGSRIWMLLRQPEQGQRWLALMTLVAEIKSGVLPEALSADCLARAVAVRDDSLDTVTAHALASSAAFHQHKDTEAGYLLETCLRYSGHSARLPEALMSDAAVFQARRRKRADLAKQWLADMPVTPPFLWLRSRVEAAILEAQGDVEGASRKLEETEKAIHSFPSGAQREISLRLLERWKSELSSC